MVTGGPGTLVPAQGVPEDEEPHRRVGELTLSVKRLLKAKKAGDERYVLGIVLEPDVVDAQDDIYSADEVRDSAHNYMEKFQNTGLMHEEIVNDHVKILESYLAPVDFTIGDESVKKGTWMMAVRVLDKALWESVKSGGLTGFSIGGSAQRVPDVAADKKHKAMLEEKRASTRKAMKTLDHQGIPVKIDRPVGHVQSGKDSNGVEWSREYKLDYGFIPKTKGGDDDELDVFMGPNPEAKVAYWIAQQKDDGTFDEYKVFLGFDSPEDAKKAYADHIPMKFYAGMREMSVEQMKSLLNVHPVESLS